MCKKISLLLCLFFAGASCESRPIINDPFQQYILDWPGIPTLYRVYVEHPKLEDPAEYRKYFDLVSTRCHSDHNIRFEDIEWWSADLLIVLVHEERNVFDAESTAALALRANPGSKQRIIFWKQVKDNPNIILHELLHVLAREGDSPDLDNRTRACYDAYVEHAGVAK